LSFFFLNGEYCPRFEGEKKDTVTIELFKSQSAVLGF